MKLNINPQMKNILEWIYCIIIAVIIALLVKYYIGTPTIVKQVSMNNTLQEGQRLWLNRWLRTVNAEYKRGDIITFEAPSIVHPSLEKVNFDYPVAVYNTELDGLWEKFEYYVLETSKVSYIKRIIGISGDHIKIEDGKVYLNGKKLIETYLKEGAETNATIYSELTVPEGYVFVMGDNREQSTDSRSFGCIPIEKIESKVAFRFWPLNKFGGVD